MLGPRSPASPGPPGSPADRASAPSSTSFFRVVLGRGDSSRSPDVVSAPRASTSTRAPAATSPTSLHGSQRNTTRRRSAASGCYRRKARPSRLDSRRFSAGNSQWSIRWRCGPVRSGVRFRLLTGVAVAAAVLLPTVALAHIERASYWPDPAPDTKVKPSAGGKVPKIRSLASALETSPPGKTRVVCHGDSMRRLTRAIRRGRAHGYDIRPTDHRVLSAKRARALLRINRQLKEMCSYRQIQPAVTASRNNDRIVVMPGLYTEPHSRKQPTLDPKCDKYEIQNDRNQTGAVSYKYQFHCPNDQNLIAIMGRRPGKTPPPQPPRLDRHGIPDLGPCIRCNLQLEGSGVSADDVVIDAGRVKSGNGGPIGAVKDVGIRGDRSDGLVIRNLTVRHAKEHGIYILEADGYNFDRFKAFYNGEYGVLTFVEDHGVMQNCEAAGSGDSGLYPGAGAETGEQRASGPYRYNQTIRKCDSHHNASGYSGTASNAIHITHNNFYDNALGFTTDVFTAAGHPGFPQDSDLIDHNNFYSNNFNPYVEGSDVEPSVPVPV